MLKEIGVRVVALEFKHLRDEASSGAPLDMHENFERITGRGNLGSLKFARG
jgi:hypothetical protein